MRLKHWFNAAEYMSDWDGARSQFVGIPDSDEVVVGDAILLITDSWRCIAAVTVRWER